MPGPYGAHGRFDGKRSRPRSWEMFTDRHRNVLWGAVLIAAAAGAHQVAKRLNI